jgi:DNA (cytosine-5)-methyltransferase 1
MTSSPVLVQVNVPNIATKQLKLKTTGNKRKLTISSNWLPLFGFEKNMLVEEIIIDDAAGFTITPASPLTAKPKRVYSRNYPKRKMNPFETLLEVGSQKLLDRALALSDRVLVIFEYQKIIVKPIANRVAERISHFLTSKKPFTAFSVCSSGVDASIAYDEGFDMEGVIEIRPNEKRDIAAKRDLTETGALSFIENVPVKALFNEDIYDVDPERVKSMLGNNQPNFMTISLSCDDFSNAKSHSLRTQSEDDLSSGLDMVYPALKLVEEMNLSTILLEQVTGFGRSAIGKLWDLALRRMGYKTFQCEINPAEHGYDANRPRYFHFATVLKDVPFSWPQAKQKEPFFWERLIENHLPTLREVTENKSMQKGLHQTGRLRVVKPSSDKFPCVLKSQSRMAADSVVIMPDEHTILWPTEALLKQVMGMGHFSQNCVSAEVASEQIGQAVQCDHYRDIIKEVKRHMMLGYVSRSLNAMSL